MSESVPMMPVVLEAPVDSVESATFETVVGDSEKSAGGSFSMPSLPGDKSTGFTGLVVAAVIAGTGITEDNNATAVPVVPAVAVSGIAGVVAGDFV